MSPIGGPIPVKQIDSIPVVSVQQFLADVNGGAASVVNGRYVRYWSPSALGLANEAGNQQDPDVTASVGDAIVLSDFVDVRGLTHFTLVVTEKVLSLAGSGQQTWNVYVQSLAVAGDGTNVTPRTGQAGRAGTGTAGEINFFGEAGAVTFPFFKVAQCSWTTGGVQLADPSGPGGGGLMRIWLHSTQGGQDQQISASLWGWS